MRRRSGGRGGRSARLLAAGLALAGVSGTAPQPVEAGAAAAAGATAAPTARARFLMGTRLVIEVAGEAAGPAAPRAIERAFAEVERLDAVLSNWRSDSEVSSLNASAAGRPFRCSADLFAAAVSALGWAEKTGGAFDPTIEPAVRRLGLRGDEGRLPGVAPEAIPSAPGPIGWRLVRSDAADHSLTFAARGMGLDFGGIGKGIALDAAAAVLRREGIAAARLDFGGQSLVFGDGPDEGGWRIGLSDPIDRDRVVGTIVLRTGSLAASGNVERPQGAGGAATPHLLDPATGAPAPFDGSVTVIAPDATAADALSTALFVMGPERGLAWAAAHGLDVLYLRREIDGSLRRSGRGAWLSGAPASTASVTRAPVSGGRP